MKRIVVASGKGGTGKTTVTALLSHLVSSEFRVVIADADVEASNLPIALHVDTTSHTEFEGLRTAYVEPGLCDRCGACVSVCRFDAIGFSDSGPARADGLACEGCGRCAAVCQHQAISMMATRAGEVCAGQSPVGFIAYGQLVPGADLSGKLVTEVRGRAQGEAGVQHSDVMLIDGPPGIGCPLIAAVADTDIVVAVAEPTISGAHDLERLAELAERLALPMCVILNKSDLSAEGASRVRELCAARHLPIVADVPFDPGIASYLERMAAASADVDTGVVQSEGLGQIDAAWAEIRRLLEI